MALALILLMIPAFIPSFCAKASVDYSLRFQWSDGSYYWSYNVTIPKTVYEQYKAVSAADRTKNLESGFGYLTTTNDPYIIGMAKKFEEIAAQQGYGSFETATLILTFVQNLPNNPTITSTFDDYPRFPLETMVDGGGDCEDTAILYTTLMGALDYDTKIIETQQRFATGILVSGDLQGTYYTYNDKNYYYCETALRDYKIGQVPSEITDGQEATLHFIDTSIQFTPNTQFESPEKEQILNFITIAFGVAIGSIVVAISVILIFTRKASKPKQPI